MPEMRWWVLLILIVACACGGSGASEQVGASTDAARPESPKEVVIALIEAFQAGDQAGVEALWARDGGTWTDAAGFKVRAAYYQKAEFDLGLESITVTGDQRNPQVVVRARREGQDYVWSFMVLEIDGTLRAGGVETRLVGLP